MGFGRTRDFIARWPTKRRETLLYREFARQGTESTLRQLLAFLQSNDLPLSVSQPEVRERLFGLDWSANRGLTDTVERELVFKAIDDFLLDFDAPKGRGEWRAWIRMSRVAGRSVKVTEPKFVHGLLHAKRSGALSDLSSEDSSYLLSCYQKSYGEILQEAHSQDRRLVLPILLEFAAIAQTLGPSEYSSTTLQRWIHNVRAKPRTLADLLADAHIEEAWSSPIRGIGSPHGISVTPYREGFRATPVRIAYAGITADRTLNAQVFAGLFSAGLASDCRRSFLTPVGGLLRLDDGESSHDQVPRLFASLTLGGRPLEPETGVSPIGMPAFDAFQLVNELFERFKACTGLVSVMHWGVDDADALEQRIRDALKSGEDSTRLSSDPSHSEGNSVIHVMPLLHRNEGGSVEPIRIPVPYSVLNPALALKLTRSARQSYMAQLIANCRRREAMASDAYKEHDKLVGEWEGLKLEQKEARCRVRPTIQITESYNFELGIVERIDPPRSMPLAEYENVVRPQLRDSAKKFASQFEEMCGTLAKLNRSDGPADQLTFKFLVDAALRQDPVLMAGEEFQADYGTWIKHATAPAWALVDDWATRRGYPIEMMAADNVLFNSEFDEAEPIVWILPHVMIDLHDFEILIDRPTGTMYALPAGRSKSIRDKLIAHPDQGITSPEMLHDKFREWIASRLEALPAHPQSQQHLRRELLSDKRFSGLVYLEQGKRMLWRGEWERSIAAFAKARPSDLAPVYFWGAVAHQCRFLHQTHQEPIAAVNMDKSERPFLLINKALKLLMDSGTSALSATASPGLWSRRLEVGIRNGQNERAAARPVPSVTAVDRDAKQYWNQLLARDPVFVKEVSKPDATIDAIEDASVKLTPAEREKRNAALHALMALDFLELAEQMKAAARSLPFSGLPLRDLRPELENILSTARTMPVEDPPGMAQIEEFGGLLEHTRFS